METESCARQNPCWKSICALCFLLFSFVLFICLCMLIFYIESLNVIIWPCLFHVPLSSLILCPVPSTLLSMFELLEKDEDVIDLYPWIFQSAFLKKKAWSFILCISIGVIPKGTEIGYTNENFSVITMTVAL